MKKVTTAILLLGLYAGSTNAQQSITLLGNTNPTGKNIVKAGLTVFDSSIQFKRLKAPANDTVIYAGNDTGLLYPIPIDVVRSGVSSSTEFSTINTDTLNLEPFKMYVDGANLRTRTRSGVNAINVDSTTGAVGLGGNPWNAHARLSLYGDAALINQSAAFWFDTSTANQKILASELTAWSFYYPDNNYIRSRGSTSVIGWHLAHNSYGSYFGANYPTALTMIGSVVANDVDSTHYALYVKRYGLVSKGITELRSTPAGSIYDSSLVIGNGDTVKVIAPLANTFYTKAQADSTNLYNAKHFDYLTSDTPGSIDGNGYLQIPYTGANAYTITDDRLTGRAVFGYVWSGIVRTSGFNLSGNTLTVTIGDTWAQPDQVVTLLLK